MTPEQILQRAQEANVKLVRFLYCDSGGTIRGKATALSGLLGRMSDGMGLTVAMMAMNSLDQLQPCEGMGLVGEVRLVPDPESFAILPYAPQSAALSCDLLTLGREPWDACPRWFLKRMGQRLAERGWKLRAAFEVEFSLARRDEHGDLVPFDETPGLSSTAMTQAAAFAAGLVTALESQGLTVELYHPELGAGQHEISVRHSEALQAADNHIKVRETIRGVAAQHSLFASLAPKPFANHAGNGAHIHFSLWDEAGRNVFHDPAAPGGLSLTARQFMAGVLQHLPALMALTCPSVNSYRRIRPQAWSSAFAAWGNDNREAAVRVASPYWSDIAGTTNLELRATDNSCNPYIALGGLIAAGLDGVARELEPGEPTDVDPALLSEDEQHERGIRRLPSSLEKALDHLENDEVLRGALGDLLARSYVAVRRSEARFFSNQSESFEIQQHFYKY